MEKIAISCANREKEYILRKLCNHKISMAQIDPFSYCNSRCWYCPVRYIPNPKQAVKQMPIELLRKIITDLDAERKKGNGIVAPNFNFIYTGHYNEILLYKYFTQMLGLLREFNIKTILLSNGTPLTCEKTDIIRQYPDVVTGICLNIPAFDPEIWSRRTGMNTSLFTGLTANIKYAVEQLPGLVSTGQFSIQINGATKYSFEECGGWLEKGPIFPHDMELDPETGELQKQKKLAENLFPGVNVYTVPSLIDRAGILDKEGVMSNKKAVMKYLKRDMKFVSGCHNGYEVGGRTFGWLHVNSLGQAFLCCNDYNFDYVFGDFSTQKLQDFWYSDLHAEAVQKAFNEICTNCASSEWSDELHL